MNQSKILLPFFSLLLLLTIFSLNIPFFWDSTFFSSLSLHFYSQGWNGFVAPEEFDTGGFPLYSSYLALTWKLFGKTLAVSHYAMLPFLFGLSYEFYKLCKRYLNDRTIIWAMILFITEPVFLTQSITMGYDILIAYFFLLALNALYQNRSALFSMALILLCLVSIRGIMLASALFFIDLVYHKKADLRSLVKYVPALLILTVWTLYHKHQTGWYIFSPLREDNAEDFAPLEMIFRQVVYILWKSVDLGRMAFWLILLFFGYVYLKKKRPPHYRELFINLFVPLAVLSFFMVFLSNPIGHKYFLVVFILLNAAACYFIQQILNRNSRILLFSLLMVSLIAGNFTVYPQRYGNAWDSSLKIIPYFNLENKIRTHLIVKKIPAESVATQYPLTTSVSSAYLSDDPSRYTDIDTSSIEQYAYFLYSNVINSGRMEDLEKIKETWTVEKEMKSGMVELILYKNPNLSFD